MRAIFEALGASVAWDEDNRSVLSYDPVSDVSISLQIDSNVMFIGETSIELEAPAKIVNDFTVVPVRAISEGMNSIVNWDESTRTVTVEKNLTPENAAPNIELPESEISDDTNPGALNPDPWLRYNSLEELNAAAGTQGDSPYWVNELSLPEYSADSYAYLPVSNMTEIHYVPTTDDNLVSGITVRTAIGDSDISGIFGGEEIDAYTLNESLVQIYKYENTVYALWTCSNAGVMYSHSVAVDLKDSESFDVESLIKTVAEDVENHPIG
jgi:hypothetical protein